jgi:hypothetical protein
VNVRRSIAQATVVIAAAALSLGLSSCGRGFDQPTDQVYNPAVGVNDQDSDVDVLNAVIVSGTDGSGTLVATLVNNDQENDDALTGISAGGGDQAQVTAPSTTTIEAGSLLNLLDEGGAKVEGESVKAGAFITLTFTFERAESATLDVPVVAHGEGAYADVPVS